MAGLGIYPEGKANQAVCTMGFGVYRASSSGTTHWMTTAGHCSLSGSGVRWWQGGRGINPLQYVGVSGQSDEAVIRVPSGLESSRIYINSSSFPITYRAQQSYEDYVGQPVCMSLGRRNVIDCGTIFDRFGVVDDFEGKTTNLRAVKDVKAEYGDSGSPVYGLAGGRDQIAYGLEVGVCDKIGGECFGHISAVTRELGTGFALVRNY